MDRRKARMKMKQIREHFGYPDSSSGVLMNGSRFYDLNGLVDFGSFAGS